MGCLTFCILSVNVCVLIAFDVLFWAGGSVSMGLAGILGIIAYFIGYSLSAGTSISRRDIWSNPEFGIFLKKIGVANTTAITVWTAIFILLAMLGL